MIRNIRLYTGWILFAYVFMHLGNHMIGLWSLETMDEARYWIQLIWSNELGRLVLSLTMLIHGGLAFYALYQRRRFSNMRANEWIQLIFGLSIPPLLILHYIGTLIIEQFYGVNPNYAWMLLIYWKGDIPTGVRQLAVLVIAWTHGCLGIYFWLRLKKSWPKLRGYVLAIALLWPTLALLGIWDASKQVLVLFEDSNWLREVLTLTKQPTGSDYAYLAKWEYGFLIGYAALLVLTLILRQLRPVWEARNGSIKITYDSGREVKAAPGVSLLEISHRFLQPHASVCGGRGRCSTCRVRINKGIENLPPASAAEQKILNKIDAEKDIRLACQCKPFAGEYSVSCLLPADTDNDNLHKRNSFHQGQEQEITVLFADLRGFTKLSESKLPYDVVFVLNRFFAMMGTAVEKNGGHLDKFIGDGVMALFGVNGQSKQCARSAMKAAKDMVDGIHALNKSLEGDLEHELQIGIGLHSGHAIIGDMGYGNATQLTAIGDTVNTASRLEGLTKDLEADLVISQDVLTVAEIDELDIPIQETAVRGRKGRLCIHVLRRKQDFDTLLYAIKKKPKLTEQQQ